MSTHRSKVATSGIRAGMTLLEVLVACGILILGLSGIAALLPAAGFQLSQAATEDRAGVLAANARSDASSRRLSAAALCSNPGLAVAFGPGLNELSSVAPAWFASAMASPLMSRIDGTRGFWLEDDLTYQPNASGDPSNTFVNVNGLFGPREFKERVCWAGMLLPGVNSDRSGAAEASAGQPATLVIATLRKAPDPGRAAKLFTLTAPAVAATPSPPPGICFDLAPQELSGEADRKQFLGPCSWVLLLPTTPGAAPVRPVQINSSWTLPNGGISQLVLRMPEDLSAPDGQRLLVDRYRTVSGNLQQFRVVAISNVVRLDQYPLNLD